MSRCASRSTLCCGFLPIDGVGLDRHAPDERRSAGDAAEDTTGVIGGHGGTPSCMQNGSLCSLPRMRRTPNPSPNSTPLHARDAERDAGDVVLHAVEHGVAKACRDVVCHTFNHGTQAVELGFCPENGLVHAPCDRGVDAGQRVCGYGALRRRAPWGLSASSVMGSGPSCAILRGDFDPLASRA